jgi:hypothetical protein
MKGKKGRSTAGGWVLSWAALAVAMVLHLSAHAPAPGTPAQSSAVLTVGGDVSHALSLTPADLKAMTRTTLTVDAAGQQTSYEGVLVGQILQRAGAPLGRDLSGPAVASYVLASGTDGCQVVFSLPELDPAFTANDVLRRLEVVRLRK